MIISALKGPSQAAIKKAATRFQQQFAHIADEGLRVAKVDKALQQFTRQAEKGLAKHQTVVNSYNRSSVLGQKQLASRKENLAIARQIQKANPELSLKEITQRHPGLKISQVDHPRGVIPSIGPIGQHSRIHRTPEGWHPLGYRGLKSFPVPTVERPAFDSYMQRLATRQYARGGNPQVGVLMEFPSSAATHQMRYFQAGPKGGTRARLHLSV